jgi:hypothetical protein
MDIMATRICTLVTDSAPRTDTGSKPHSEIYIKPYQILLRSGIFIPSYEFSTSLLLCHSSHVDAVVLLYVLGSRCNQYYVTPWSVAAIPRHYMDIMT